VTEGRSENGEYLLSFILTDLIFFLSSMNPKETFEKKRRKKKGLPLVIRNTPIPKIQTH